MSISNTLRDDVLRLLKAREWSADHGRKCPFCGWKKTTRHHEDCQLGKVISLLESEPISLKIDEMPKRPISIDRLMQEIAAKDAEIERLKANQFPNEPICTRCGKPRKSLGVLWDIHVDCKKGK